MAAAVKTAPAPSMSFIDRVRNKRGGKPLTVPQAEDELQAIDTTIEHQRQRQQAIEVELVDADGPASASLQAEHQGIALYIQTNERRRAQLIAERAEAEERVVVAAHAELCDDLSRMASALAVLEAPDGELVRAHREYTKLIQQSAELRFNVNRQQQLIGDHRSANPRAAEALKAVESGIADLLDRTYLAHWRPK